MSAAGHLLLWDVTLLDIEERARRSTYYWTPPPTKDVNGHKRGKYHLRVHI